MKKRLLNLITVVVLSMCGLSVKAQTTDSVVNILPKWKKGDTHTMKIKVATTDEKNGVPKTYTSTFTSVFKIIDATDDGYVGDWTYTDAKVVPTDPQAENHIIAALLNIPIKIKLFGNGQFDDILNTDEVKTNALQLLKKLEAINKANEIMQFQIKLARKTLDTDQGTEILLKQIKIYFVGYGYSFTKGKTKTTNLQMANVFGGEPFDVVEKAHISETDNTEKLCTIESDRKVDGPAIKAAIQAYFKKVSPPQQHAEIDAQLGKAKLDFSEKSVYQYRSSTGLMQKTSFRRIMNLGIQNRTMFWEIECVN